MGIFLWLATTASAAAVEAAEKESTGFGLHFDIFESNLINLTIVIAILIYFGRGFLGKILGERRENIEQAIKEAEERVSKASESLSDAQQKLTQAQAEAEKIRVEAEARAKTARDAILAQAEKDVIRLQEDAVKDLDSERERAIAELRQRASVLALQRVESQLKDHLDNYAQEKLIDRSIVLLGDSR
jgi:F-type H+-transporting ATPase subunit b